MSVNPANYNQKKIINPLHYNRVNNTIVEPVAVPAPTAGFEFSVEVAVRKSTDLTVYGTTFLRYTIYKNFYLFYIDHVYIPDTGAAVQDIIFVDFPFNSLNGPAPFNPTLFTITANDTTFVLNGDNRAGTIQLAGGLEPSQYRLLIWPDKLLNGNQIPANAEIHFGNSCFMVAMFNNNL